VRAASRVGRPGSEERRAAIAGAVDYTFEQLQNTRERAAAVVWTQALLAQAGASREDWYANREASRRPLSAHEPRKGGVDNADGEVWDVERLMSNADWAVHDFVREGIDASFRQQWAVEEQDKLLLHVHRMCRWLGQQAGVLFRALQDGSSFYTGIRWLCCS
jgi:hypothetical protein